MTDGRDEIRLTRDEVKAIVKESVDETLQRIGIESSDQRAMQSDMLFLRKLRKTNEAVQNKALLTLLGTLIVGTIGLILMGIGSWIHSAINVK